MSIQQYLDKVKNAVFGKDIRQAIHDAIKRTYDDASKEGNANMEVSLARGDHDTLNDRLVAFEGIDNSLQQEIFDLDYSKADQTYVATVLQSAVSGAPKEFYYTVSALQNAYPEGTSGTILVLEDGHIYIWNGSSWEDAGLYQSTEWMSYMVEDGQPWEVE